jgi:hypothetical protein
MTENGGGTQSEEITSEPITSEPVAGHPEASTSRGSRVASALLALSKDHVGTLNPYLCRHLSGHVAYADAWPQLAAATGVLDSLDISALTSDVLNTTLGWKDLPIEIAGTITNRQLIDAYPAKSRAWLRVLGGARVTGYVRDRPGIEGLSRVKATWARRFSTDSVSVDGAHRMSPGLLIESPHPVTVSA